MTYPRPCNQPGHNLTQQNMMDGWFAGLGGARQFSEGKEIAYVQRWRKGWYAIAEGYRTGPHKTRREAMAGIQNIHPTRARDEPDR